MGTHAQSSHSDIDHVVRTDWTGAAGLD